MMELVQVIKNDVCRDCEFCSFGGALCSGEMLPIERAIERNLKGLGLCVNIRQYANKLWKGDKNENSRNM